MRFPKNHALVAGAFALLGVAHAQPVFFTGDVEADFGPGAVIQVDPAGVDVGMPLQYPVGTVSGNDIKDVRFSYDAATDTMYVGINTFQIATDVDSQEGPDVTGPVLAGLGGNDAPAIGGTESVTLIVDVDQDGVPDVTIGVSAETDIDGFQAALFAGSVFAPGLAYGMPIAQHRGATSGAPSAGSPDFEFTVPDWSALPSSGVDLSAGFGINAFIGSFGDAGIGEDFVPGVGTFAPICLGGTEVCDGIDNDCDGTVDEGFDVGSACNDGVGACRTNGVVICQPDGSSACSATPADPQAETCNDRDDDCDGSTDEGVGGGLCTGELPGVCAEGRLRCAEGQLSCVPAIRPSVETCDNRDEDCDGQVDEGFNVGSVCSVGVGECASGGVFLCDRNGGARCSGTPGDPTPEVCDGGDDDCDGRTDEGFDVGATCNVGVGACAADGVNVCDARGGVRCSATQGDPGFETCNGIDDDCDGRTDEGTGGEQCTTGNLGVCADGVLRCEAGRLSCESAQQPRGELCNNTDDDCDGRLDEGLGVGQACVRGVGACRVGGINICDGEGGTRCSATPADPQAETCNTVDDDCDGSTDEGFGIGDACSVGVGACANDGQLACDGNGGVACNAQPGQPGAETCDGVDNDCDGQIDEGFGLGEVCETGVGACMASGVRVCGPDGQATCDAQPGRPEAEVCDDNDNDCDGRTDEGLGLGDICIVGEGACAEKGTNVCDGRGGVTCSAEPGQPAAEICNDADDDCDGRTDEGTGAGEACNVGQGACAADGVNVCDGNGGTRCSATPGDPGAEVCDRADNDCDGEVDEDLGVGDACEAGEGACRKGGQIVCNGEGGTVCNAKPGAPGPEICDSADNDCDGSTDEGFGLGEACREGVGACGADGVRVCDMNGEAACDAMPGDPRPEVCDDADNDCDGSTDEGIGLGDACTVGDGACAANGVNICDGDGGLRCSATPVDPGVETCNNRDDDCDGSTDEGFGVGDECAEGVGACRGTGTVMCDANGGTMCDATPGYPGDETCDGIDNDCDGTLDEGTGGGACNSGEAGACGPGTNVCEGGALRCVPTAQPGDEACNSRDDDCDGSIDEGFGVGDECAEGVGACRNMGSIICDANGATACDATPGYPVDEICDGIDNDCDGQIDEGTGGDACNSGEAGACGPGTNVCEGGALRCVPNAQPGDETCNGADDDCDGRTDEGFGIGEMCERGVGACAVNGVNVCDGEGGARCSATPADPNPETCNAADDDCDGSTDEGLGGDACESGEPGVCGPGTTVCAGGEIQCQPNARGGDETCDGTDEDCDGRVDEGFGVGDDCRAGEGACAADGNIVCRDGEAACEADLGEPADELCDNIDNDCDGEVDEASPTSVYAADEYSPRGHAFWAPNFYGDGARTRMHFEDDAIFITRDDGTAALTGTAVVFDGGVRGERWFVEAEFVLRGTGPEFGGPKIERAAAQPPAITDLWTYYDMTRGTVSRGTIVASLAQRPADGRFPFQLGDRANGKNDNFGAAVWFSWILRDGDEILRQGHGDFNLNLAPIPVCGALCEDGEGPAPETCNGADDDCDGLIDEGFGIGGACKVGEGACGGEGERVCSADGGVVCSAQPGEPAAETCDAQDNDCDGNIDEGFGLGDECTAGAGACAETGEVVCADDGSAICNAEPGEPTAELCDGIDNDCDESIDEDGPRTDYVAREFAGGHALWLPGLYERGLLVRMRLRDDGRLTIQDGVARLTGTAYLFINSGGPGEIGEEWDVDISWAFRGVGPEFGGPKVNRPQQTPEVTADWAYYDMIPEQARIRRGNVELRLTQMPADGRYPFQIGHWANMMNGTFGASSWFFWTKYVDGEQVANGHGDVNVDLEALAACGVICDPAEGEPAAETCDGRDNDCDGVADEGFDLGEVCVNGDGACGAIGETICNPAGDGVICDAEPGAPADEICDAVDNDCDGTGDEGLGLGEPCSEGQGACAADGETVCDGNGGVTCSAEPGQPQGEACDALDNDCDGNTDEGLGLGDACSAGVGACAADGEIICDGDGATACSAEPGQPAAETCDGLDNDCDGRVDEGLGLGERCSEGLGACAADGEIICDGNGGTMCNAEPAQPGDELCDDLDNDCDGHTDEGFGVGDACSAGQGLCRDVGERVCDGNGGVVCDATPGAPADELCDEEDNDCDGLIDEDFDLDGDCAVGIGECRRDGQRICGEDDVVAGLGGNLILNGSFEQPRLDRAWRVYQEIEGWTTIAGQGIEIQRINGAADGDQYVELDSHPTPGGGCMMQVIPVDVGGIYRLSVSHSPRPNVADNRVALYWDGVEVAELDGDGRGLGDTSWTRHQFDVTGNGAQGTLVICDVTNDRDTLGGFVDDVTLEMVEGIMCDAEPGEPVDERCDGLDNDCDGYTDEDLGIGDDCQVGVGACAAAGAFQCDENGDVVCAGRPGDPAAEQCDEIDNDCDGQIDEGACAPEGPDCEELAAGTVIYGVTAWDDDHYGLYLPNWNERGHRTDMLFRPGATFTVNPDGTAQLTGTAYVNSLGGGAGVLGEEWQVAMRFELRGTGPEHGGPYRERAEVQPPEVTDLWTYYNMTEGTLTRGGVVANMRQYPVDGRFPFQMGVWANGRSGAFGASNWYSWQRQNADGSVTAGVGDMNINLDEICADRCEPEAEVCDGADNDCDGVVDEDLDCDPLPPQQCPQQVVLDFQTDANGAAIPAGADLADAYAAWGVRLTTTDRSGNTASTGIAFDSANPTGGDPDLGTPNQDFGGPGRGDGGRAGRAGENTAGLGNLLIRAENTVDADGDGVVDVPDDHAGGARFTYSFDGTACVYGADLVDIEDRERGATFAFYDVNGALIDQVAGGGLGNNSYERLEFDVCGVSRMVVSLIGSGAIDNIEFCIEEPVVLPPLCERADVYNVSEFAENGHAFVFPNFDGDGRTVRMHLRDDAQFVVEGDEGRFIGTAYRTDNGDEWGFDVRFAYRGQGPEHGGPKIERPQWQPAEVTDLWHYFDMTQATLMHDGIDVARLTQMPADGRYPLQVGMAANGKNPLFGMSSWYTWVRENPEGRREGRGDINVNLEDDCE